MGEKYSVRNFCADPFEGAELELELNPEMEKPIIEFLNLEVEVLRGTREVLTDGRVKINIHIDDEHKADACREFCLKMISKSHLANGN